ncbi:hypothetical protein [Pelodictyon luteolum]|uniref:DUF3352 domain-containing protein n=1 Tax=Chlorobium luteolum (strain DSM 273 / BCRC 81028 / 2530) TaxID=319225 RepID=Q3B2G9_CHLL3|nr:hypothetical protein [Pelodictyon luteolum]ABB24462.1 conserved hypothetical protein [Pelodictyon luteolum DSM 273]
MKSNPEGTGAPLKRSLKKGSGLLMVMSLLGFLGFLSVLFWINWPKPRPVPEPLPPAVKSLIERIPGRSDAIIYLGMKDVRQSRFWQEVLPDSLRDLPLFEAPETLQKLMTAAAIIPARDIDTLLVTFRKSGYREQHFLCVAKGPFASKLTDELLQRASRQTASIAGQQCYGIDSTLWVSRTGPNEAVLADNKTMLSGYLNPEGSFLTRDSLAVAMIEKATYKSHLWFALPSAAWTSSALKSLTSKNSDVNTLGNLNHIQHLALSIKMNDGIKAETEWVYKTKPAAWFASTFLWGAVKLSAMSTERTTPETRALLEKIQIQQNLESVIIRADLPLETFTHATGSSGRNN